ncbi:hypothetical protein CSPX01_03908 [Colletotrichum filicis]|nr:hypothetical protein CSPX01_03908 [Colletotrichum filicis]
MLQSPRKPTYTVVFAATAAAAAAAAAIVNFVLDQLPRIAPHRIASQVPGLLPAFSLPLPPPITAASSSAINSSTQQATHVEHQRPASRTTQKQGTRTRHTESTSHANARPSASWEPATTAAQGALASLAPSSLSPALSVTVAATTNCPLLKHSTAQHRTAPHHFRPSSCLLCFASLQQKQGERRCCKT